MLKINLKKLLVNSTVVLIIFLVDRFSKIYILKIAALENKVDIYISEYLNLYLIWNKGIAFGLFSFEENLIYNLISLTIFVISLVIIAMIIKSSGFRKYVLIIILGGALSNLFDRVYYSAVPDFIDFHVNNYHWFIFNVADIFITFGVICLIYEEIFLYKKNNDKKF
jgi:signal peptidase II